MLDKDVISKILNDNFNDGVYNYLHGYLFSVTTDEEIDMVDTITLLCYNSKNSIRKIIIERWDGNCFSFGDTFIVCFDICDNNVYLLQLSDKDKHKSYPCISELFDLILASNCYESSNIKIKL